MSVPLPFFDQNRAQIAAAVANLHEAELVTYETSMADLERLLGHAIGATQR